MEKLIRPVFTLDLNYKINPNLVTIGKFDGTHPCLTAATTADKVLIHSPHRKNQSVPGRICWSETNREIATLNINQSITAIVAGNLVSDDDKDVLLIGTHTHILAYHVHDNKDIFYKECLDGVRTIALGCLKNWKSPVVIIGGNSSVSGFDYKGNEIFWLAVGDIVTSLALVDYNKDGSNEIIVGCEDFNIKVFNANQIIAENLETEVVTGLVALTENKFSYSVSNGTIGVYEQEIRLWRVKSKHFAISMHSYDLLGHGSTQLITGWSNGKIDCRDVTTGEVLFKDTLNAGIAGVVEGDYRSIGKSDLICVSVDGEVRGYTTLKFSISSSTTGLEQDTVRELFARKQALLLELKHYDKNTKFNENSANLMENYECNGVIPVNTKLQINIAASEQEPNNNVEILVSTNNTTIIKAVLIFAEGIFKGETHVIHLPKSKLSSELSIPIFLPRDISVDIHIKALVGYPNSAQFHVFEITKQLPSFSMYCKIQKIKEQPEGYVELKINERLQRICLWINQNFLLSNEIECENDPVLKLHLNCLRDKTVLSLGFGGSGQTRLYTNNMGLAADVVQSLASFLKIECLEAKAYFPMVEKELIEYIRKLSEIQGTRLRLGTDLADRLGQIRSFIIRVEDSRLNDIWEMSKYFNQLHRLNMELINTYNIRLRNFDEGLETIKIVNLIVQRASRLRVGIFSTNIINGCRAAIKNNNVDGMLKIIQTGEM